MPAESIETLIIGGGQAGLTMSHMLSRHGCAHLVLERHRIAERWRTERWDSLRFQVPNWCVRLPDFPFAHTDPDAFATSAEILDFITAYAAFVAPPIRCGVAVTALRRQAGAPGFVAETSDGPIKANNVVVATGPYQRPIVPPLLSEQAGVFQVHASRYRNPQQLPPGAVLVVGASASGAQIAEELLRAGRQVYLSVGRHRRIPRRYRGHDAAWWTRAMGMERTPVEHREMLPVVTGAYGGHTIDFRAFAAQGMVLLGHAQAACHGVMEFAEDLAGNLAQGDAAYQAFLDRVDAHVASEGLNVPADTAARTAYPDPPCVREPLRRLDLRATGISAVVWATGYGLDFSWIDLPVLDAQGAPLHRQGIAAAPGLYFLGLEWLSKFNSSFVTGVGDDAARLADHIAAARSRVSRPAADGAFAGQPAG